MWRSIIAVALGSTIGGLSRWGLSMKFSNVCPPVPAGTLASNLIAGYVIGLAIAYFSQAPFVSPPWRLFVMTGFCGGLSTFSTFSAEVVALLQQGRLMWAMAAMAFHLGGSLLMTLLGIATIKFIGLN